MVCRVVQRVVIYCFKNLTFKDQPFRIVQQFANTMNVVIRL